MRARALALLLLIPSLAFADPPKLVIPAEIRPAGQYVSLLPDTDAVSITYVGLSGVDPIPSAWLRDGRQFALDTRGLAVGRYSFAAVGASKTGEQARADFVVVIGTPPPAPVPPGPVPPDPKPPDPKPAPVEKATAATFVYEKDQHALPPPVLAALNRLNRERGIVATVLEADTKDGTGEVPEQYKVPLAAAKEAGLPALVVTGLKGVIRVVKDPKTEQAVMDAVPAEGKK